jgi:adenosylhomocysteine nucleosidase
MGSKVAIIAALPREIAGLVRGVRPDAALAPRKIYLYRLEGAVVVAAGMGAARVALAVEAALAAERVSALLSVGVAGGCDPEIKVGEIVRAGVVIDVRTGERFEDSQFRQVLVCAPEIASVREKKRLYAAYGASAVDMEAATVARLAVAHGIHFGAVKAISDEAEFELRELGQFATSDGQFREVAFAVYAIVRPRMWGKVVALARNGGRAIDALTASLRDELRSYRDR